MKRHCNAARTGEETRTPRGRSPSGFSLLEMLIALSVLGVITGASFQLYMRFSQHYRVEMEASDLTAAGERTMSRLLSDLRSAGYPQPSLYGTAYTGSTDNLVSQDFRYNTASGVQAVNLAASSMTFEAALGNTGPTTIGYVNPVVDIVNYQLVNIPGGDTQLQRQVTAKTINGAPGAVISNDVLYHVQALTFTYYDANGNVLGPLPLTASQAPAVQMIQCVLNLQTKAVDARTNQPMTLTFSGSAFVRQ